MSVEDEDRIDQEFLDEYIKLCRKYKRKFEPNCWEQLSIDILEDNESCGSFSLPAEARELYRIKQEREKEERQEREAQSRKVREDYVKNGGTLDEKGGIPVAPYGVIYWQNNWSNKK